MKNFTLHTVESTDAPYLAGRTSRGSLASYRQVFPHVSNSKSTSRGVMPWSWIVGLFLDILLGFSLVLFALNFDRIVTLMFH